MNEDLTQPNALPYVESVTTGTDVSKTASNDLLAAGDYAKVIGENIVFMVYGFTKGREFVPDGWYLDIENVPHNPKFCEKYKGAISAINGR